jgi:hypothetical protein
MNPDGTFCYNWCMFRHVHHPTIGQEVVIMSELVYGLKGRHAEVIRATEGTESGDVIIALLPEKETKLSVYFTEIGPIPHGS